MKTVHSLSPHAAAKVSTPSQTGPAPASVGDPAAFWTALREAASLRYRPAGLYAWRFARGKLGMDPVFRHLLENGLLPSGAHVLDIGCGQGLLASLLRAASETGARLGWPSAWAPAPTGCRVTGIELVPRDVDRARAALHAGGRSSAVSPAADDPSADHVICGDLREVPYPNCDVVVILDVLHYIPVADQDAVLRRVHAALVPGGRLLLRVGDEDQRFGFRFSQWVDRAVARWRGLAPRTFGRRLSDWTQVLASTGFEVEARPMSQGTPFANVLLVARRTDPDKELNR